MRVTKKGAESTIKPYLFEEAGMIFLHEDMVEQAMDDVTQKYCNVYCGVEEGQAGSKKLVISSVNKSKMTKFVEVYIRYLWIILHKDSCNGSKAHRKNYITPLNQAYGEKFENMDEYKRYRSCLVVKVRRLFCYLESEKTISLFRRLIKSFFPYLHDFSGRDKKLICFIINT